MKVCSMCKISKCLDSYYKNNKEGRYRASCLGDTTKSVLSAYRYLVNAYEKPLHLGKSVVLLGRNERTIDAKKVE